VEAARDGPRSGGASRSRVGLEAAQDGPRSRMGLGAEGEGTTWTLFRFCW